MFIFKKKLNAVMNNLENKGYICKLNFRRSPENIGIYHNHKSISIETHLKNVKDKAIVYYTYFIVIYDVSHTVFIVDKLQHIKHIAEYLKVNIQNSDCDQYIDDIENYKYELLDHDLLQNNTIKLSENLVTVYKQIIPSHYVKDKRIYDIPDEMKIRICSFEITINSRNEIIALQLDNNTHPNADKNGFYCLGQHKHQKLTDKIVKELYDRISIYNLDDCYCDPFKQRREHHI
jgi:hypothetical protein